MDEPGIRRLDTAQIKWLTGRNQAEVTAWTLLVACDELIKRKEPITSLPKSFESLVRSLPTRQLKHIDENESSFELATVFAANFEMRARGIAALIWYAETGEGRIGPCDRMALQDYLRRGKMDKNTLVWREGMKEWKPLSSISGFDRSYFFRQELPVIPQTLPANRADTSGSFKMAGIIQFLSFPFWLAMLLIAPITGAGSSVGWAAPLLLSLIMSGISIPLGIGLYKGAEWAVRVKSVAALLTSAWFLSWYLIDEMSGFWLLAASVELILLTFVFVSSRIKTV